MRRAGPLVWVGFDGFAPPDDLLVRLRDGDAGGVILFGRNIGDASQTRDLVRAIHAARPIPICVDQEGGDIVRIAFGTVFPSAMAFGAARDAALAERAARVVARELRSLGIGVLLAPVCDVNVEPRNPVIGTRAFSDDPALAATLAAAWVRGAQGEGVACVAKHFPGHGATTVDSHLELPEVRADRETLGQRELVPFQAAIEAGVAAVMSAHVRFTALGDRPATYSRAILEDLLRRRLAFDGLAMSDALEMKGAQLENGAPAATAVAAGIDVALLSNAESYDEAIDGIEASATSGGIPPERLADALRRARSFAARWSHAPAEAFPAPDALAREVAVRAITHVGPALPDRGSGPLVIAAYGTRRGSRVEDLADPLGVLERELRARFGERLRFARDPETLEVPRGSTVVLVTASACFDEAQAARARRNASHPRTVLCAIRSPYDAGLFPELPALLTYSDVPASCAALAAVLSGEVKPRGALPVRLTG